ncbi:Avirulence protein (Avh) [Phytophthora palmivora]|uniref:RxLR effector protein n=1 Tax=Phytophthora palmivora TaxID=4796 RepID=A0A2P4WYD3_9STRA|nr:Avirulence protein (Avh) [Phytophthora palmivora]
MRALYVLLVAATTFLANSESLSLAMDSDQAQLSQLEQNTAQANRFLRTNKATDDEERGGWAHILGFWRTRDDAIDVMGDWLAKSVSPEKVASFLDVSKYDKKNRNFEALVEYVRMTHRNVKGEDMTRAAAKAYLKTIL